jgi:hypothetical protein
MERWASRGLKKKGSEIKEMLAGGRGFEPCPLTKICRIFKELFLIKK